MYTERHSPAHPLITFGLNLLSVPFKTISLFNLLRKKIGKRSFPAFIISVDNLSFGGTGKTTLVTDIGRALEKQGIPFAIVTRGYKGKYEKDNVRVLPLHSAADVGDEAKLFQLRFPRQGVYVGKDRCRSITQAIQDHFKIILLDDGFQSTQIQKDIKIMLINPKHPYYYLRNFKWLMKQEDYVFYFASGGTGQSQQSLDEGDKIPTRPVTGYYWFEPLRFCDGNGNEVIPGNDSFLGFSALGDNSRFREDLKSLNLKEFIGFKDHHPFSQKDLETLNELRRSKKIDRLICTEKDFVKLFHLNLEHIPFLYVQNSIKFSFELFSVLLTHAGKKSDISA